MNYKEEIQVITTINKFLRFHTNPSNQHYVNYHEITGVATVCPDHLITQQNPHQIINQVAKNK